MIKQFGTLFTAVLAALISSSSYVHSEEYIEKWAGVYLCTDTAAGGVRYNDTQKKWVGTEFTRLSGSQNHLINVKFKERFTLQSSKAKGSSYSITITDTGSSYSSNCVPRTSKTIDILDDRIFHVLCFSGLHQHVLNLKTLRSMSFYTSGYTSGLDNNDNTPSITIGECAKIQ